MDNYYVAIYEACRWVIVNQYPLTQEGADILASKHECNHTKILKEANNEDDFVLLFSRNPNNDLKSEIPIPQ